MLMLTLWLHLAAANRDRTESLPALQKSAMGGRTPESREAERGKEITNQLTPAATGELKGDET
jgi:hypothetical protein